jgi:hypothetical protein
MVKTQGMSPRFFHTHKKQRILVFSKRIDARFAEEIAEDCLGVKKTPDLEVDNESIGYRLAGFPKGRDCIPLVR